MNKNIIQPLKVITLALVLSVGISYVSAWTAPTMTPPNGNVAAPINVGSTAQTKSGSLNIVRNPISADTELGSYGVSGASSGVGYVTVGRGGSNNGGFLGWDYTNSGVALNAHSAGGSVGGLFVKRADNAHSNVGIGTVNPDNAFDVVGSSYLSGTVNAQDVYSRDAGKWMSQLGGGVTSLTAGSGISLSGSTGAVTVSSTGGSGTGITGMFYPLRNKTISCNIWIGAGCNIQATASAKVDANGYPYSRMVTSSCGGTSDTGWVLGYTAQTSWPGFGGSSALTSWTTSKFDGIAGSGDSTSGAGSCTAVWPWT